jgi:hypothetical protein
MINFQHFQSFMAKTDATTTTAVSTDKQAPGLPDIPVDAPVLQDGYSHRPKVEKEILDLLVGRSPCVGNCISAYGMGGAGKTCITSQVIRTNIEVREKFNDGIAWIAMSQKPKIRHLQRRMHFQLLREHLPKDKHGLEGEQHLYIAQALKNSTILIVIDGRDDLSTNSHFDWQNSFADCWDVEHHKYFDVIDKNTESRMLLTTRYIFSIILLFFFSFSLLGYLVSSRSAHALRFNCR